MCSVKNSRSVLLFWLYLVFLPAGNAHPDQGVSPEIPPADQEQFPFIIEHADHFYHRQSTDSVETFVLKGSVRVKHSASLISCGTLTYFPAGRYFLCVDSVHISDPGRNMLSDTLFYYVDSAYYQAFGHFQWTSSGFSGSGQKGDYYRQEGRMVVTGEASARDSLREIKADKLEYYDSSETIKATGGLRFFDRQTYSDAVASSGLYERRTNLVTLYGRPKVTYYEENDTLHLQPYYLTGDLLRSFSRDSLCATGRVRLWDDSLTVTADSLFYDKKEGISYFRNGGPQVESQSYRLTGSLIDVTSSARRLRRVRAMVKARGEFYNLQEKEGEKTSDKEEKKRETSWVEGDTLDILFGPAGLDSIAALGDARSYFCENRESGINYLQGKRIYLIWQDEKLDRVDVEGGGRGLFLKPDTTAGKAAVSDSAARGSADKGIKKDK
jgi:lipopolysaccharide export system protein LptA